MLKVFMRPRTLSFNETDESGIRRVVEAWEHYLPRFGIEFVEDGSEQVKLGHAGSTERGLDVLAAAGLYWSARDKSLDWEYKANVRVINAFRHAKEVIVPSHWVAENIARDMRFYPHVIGHGIECSQWEHDESNMGFVLWNKNRTGDVCNPTWMYQLAHLSPEVEFVTTYSTGLLPNVHLTGLMPHHDMKIMVQRCGVYLSTTKETFGIGILEAMASGKPVLGFDYGGNRDLVKHGVNGYLARPEDINDLKEGLDYCLKYGSVLGENGKEMAKAYRWEDVCRKVAKVLELATSSEDEKVSIIIPCYNYGDKVGRAIDSALSQSYPNIEVIVVDDGSTDDSVSLIREHIKNLKGVTLLTKSNGGVASARNFGIEHSTGQYIVCLDADDAIEPDFVKRLMPEFALDNSLGIVYSGLRYILPDGQTGISTWPSQWDYDEQLRGNNQVPTCCVFKKRMWQRLGGFKSRACPKGAGFEDADLWLRAGAYGFQAKKVTELPLFIYSWKSGRYSSQSNDQLRDDAKFEIDSYKTWYPWYTDHLHPFASWAKPDHFTHPVRQYDEPDVSVIIPVGPGHEQLVISALDSLDSQTYRNWEGIIVWDSSDTSKLKYIRDTYPYIRIVETSGKKGAGHARNQGAKLARAPLLLFLDADDWLYPRFIELSVDAYMKSGNAIYTDYMGKAFIGDEKYLIEMNNNGRLKYWDEETQEAVISHRGLDFDCAKVMQQPEEPFYVWNNITTLHPKAWFDEIGGFDESMETWEDWLYWLQLARNGHCFTCIHEPLMVYRFYTGGRRDIAHTIDEKTGRHKSKSMLDYIRKRLKETDSVGCTGCGNKGGNTSSLPVKSFYESGAGQDVPAGEEYQMCRYFSANVGDHRVSSPSGVKPEGYGYRTSGERFLVHVADIRLAPDMFIVEREVSVPRQATPKPEAPAPIAVPTPAPTVVEPKLMFDAQAVEASVPKDEYLQKVTPSQPEPVKKRRGRPPRKIA